MTYHLEAAVDLTRAVHGFGGRTDMATLAAALSYSGVRNGAFLTRLANARLFGLVAGRSGEVTLLDRGRRCLSDDAAEARRARAEACLDVPLFRRVFESFAASGAALPDPAALAETLIAQFGEAPARALTTARVLIDSAGQAGILAGGVVKIPQVGGSLTNFTDSRKLPRSDVTPPVASPRGMRMSRIGRRLRLAGEGGQAMVDHGSGSAGATGDADEGALWIDEGTAANGPGRGWRRTWVTAGAAACLLAIGLPVGLLVTNGSTPGAPHHTHHRSAAVHLGGGPAKRSVLAALSATTDAGSFNFSYNLSESPGTSTPPTTTCGTAYEGGPALSCGTSDAEDTDVQGSGIINTNPMAMAASASISQDGNEGLQVGVRVDPTTVWEVSNTDNGLTPQSTDDGGGSALPGFAGITEGTLGAREGAVAMMGMASPTGYLDLVQPAISGAAEVGTSTVGGVAVTQYELAIDPSSLATAPGVSSAEASTITSALAVLTNQGFTTMRALVSVDASGFIRESSSTVNFSDGGSVTLDAQFSNFGCAGTVLMPGQGGTSTPPANCTTPDTGSAPTTTTTPTTTLSPPSTTVVTPGGTPTTTTLTTVPTTTSTTAPTTPTTGTAPTTSSTTAPTTAPS